MKFKSINPANNEIIGETDTSTPEEILQKIHESRNAQREWGNKSTIERVEILTEVLAEFKDRLEEIGTLATKSMGMPIALREELDLGAGVEYFEWYLENAENGLHPEVSFEDETTINTVYREPIGVAAVISPWNFPFCQFVWQVIPNLIVGNTVVYKHASECILVGKLIEEIIHTSSLPEGVFLEVYGGSEVGEILINADVDMIGFTGSTTVGKRIAEIASTKLIKTVLELGGSAPGIIFDDADETIIAETIFFNRFANSGQICDGLKRLIVHKNIAEKVNNLLVEMLNSKKMGNPEDASVEFGPLVSEKQANTLLDQVNDAISKGATVLIGGKKPNGLSACYFEPTLLSGVTTEMKVWKEEVFGPVLPIITFETEEEAINLANDTLYGLGSYVLTEDKEKAARVAGEIKAGMVSINGTLYLHPASPFGGYKQSGFGREHGKYGFHELTQIKVISSPK